MAKEEVAYKKGWAIIRSCKTGTQIINAYNWVFLYREMYGKTEGWKKLYNFCSRRRNRL